MSEIGAPAVHTAVPIGEVSAPPFARRPDALALFATRAARLQALAPGHALQPYLEFLAAIATAQAALLPGLPPAMMPATEAIARSRQHAMPPLDRATLTGQPACQDTIRQLLDALLPVPMPDAARAALEALRATPPEGLLAMAEAVLDVAIPVDALAAHVLVAAGLQLHAARLAAQLEAEALVPVGDGACPACGSAPVSSVIVGWQGAHGARFCACSLCGTLWNYVRIRCTACGSTKGISYQELPDTDGSIKAESCGECRTYLKILNQTRQPALDPVADDVATSALDLLMAEDGVRRSGVNPFLLGY